jgi:hypothetical protein
MRMAAMQRTERKKRKNLPRGTEKKETAGLAGQGVRGPG